jgi:hypothetical protein
MHHAFHALLVEGTSGAGKSATIDALLRLHVAGAAPRKLRSLTHLAQTHTYGPLAPAEDRGTLTVAENCAHLERIVAMLEWLHGAHDHSSIPSFAIVDTLHLTHCLRPGVVTWDDVAPYDERLAAIGCKLVLLTVDAYARKFGSTNDAILDHFAGEQQALLAMLKRTRMPALHLQADGDLATIARAAFAFWHAS